MAGTILGGLIAAAAAALVHSPFAMMAVIFVGAAVTLAMLPINYGLYSLFVTPTLSSWPRSTRTTGT